MQESFTTPKFARNVNVEFNKTLNERVSAYFSQRKISKHANVNMVLKTVFMLALYFVPFIFTFYTESIWLTLLLWFVAGLGMARIGLSVMHDANHGAYSSNQNVNKFVGAVLNLLGGNPTNWKIQHNVLHHTFTNVEGFDEDIDAPVKLLRFSPHTAWRPVHKYQYLYAWFFYPLMTIMWFATKDYKQAIRYGKKGLVTSQGKSAASHWTSIILGKIVYASIFLVLPLIFAPVSWPIVLVGFVIKQFVSGTILALIFQPAHVIPDASFEKPDDSGDIQADAKVHQLLTTANYGVKSKWFTWLVGGLNFQVEHHLFPTICHVHYRGISEIVRNTAKEYNLPYHTNRTFFSALKAHGKMLRMLGQKDCPEFVHV